MSLIRPFLERLTKAFVFTHSDAFSPMYTMQRSIRDATHLTVAAGDADADFSSMSNAADKNVHAFVGDMIEMTCSSHTTFKSSSPKSWASAIKSNTRASRIVIWNVHNNYKFFFMEEGVSFFFYLSRVDELNKFLKNFNLNVRKLIGDQWCFGGIACSYMDTDCDL